MGWVRRGGCALVACAAIVAVAGCAGAPQALPTIGSPEPTPTATPVEEARSAALARRFDLRGAKLPDDWPDVPLPRGTEVITSYAIGSEPRRTWTATFAGDGGTALDLAAPVVAQLRARKYAPIAEYVGAAETNTGLYSFAAPTFAIYIVLGADNDRPNVVITVRGSTSPTAGLPGASASGIATVEPGGRPAPSGGSTSAAASSARAASGSAPSATPTRG